VSAAGGHADPAPAGAGASASLADAAARARALAALARGGDAAALAEWRRLCGGVSLKDLTPASDSRRAKEFAALLAGNAELIEAYRQWASLTPGQRLWALQTLASLFSQAYGLPRTAVKPFDFKAEQGGILAFQRADGELLVDTAALADRDAAMDAVLHQSWHRYQEDLISRLDRGQLPAADDRYALAQLMAAELGAGVAPLDHDSYRSGPMEAQARLFDGAGSQALAALAGGRDEVRDLAGDLSRALAGEDSGSRLRRMLIASLLGLSGLIGLVMGWVVIRRESGG
jgi:hypothetical protein